MFTESVFARRISLLLVGAMVATVLAIQPFMAPAAEASGAEPVVHFVIDTSGSMAGARIAAAKAAVSGVVDELDGFDVAMGGPSIFWDVCVSGFFDCSI